MKKLIGLFLLGVLILALLAIHINPHVTFDASYYHVMAERLTKGNGFVEPVVWQYLNNYEQVEHPMDYWMPLGVLAYSVALKIGGPAGEISLNIIIWAFLAVMVFREVVRQTNSNFCAAVAFFLCIFHGRNLFYLLTTDNFAFSALLGYLIVQTICDERPHAIRTAFFSGLLALLRIEGLAFAFFSGIWELRKNWRLKTAVCYATTFFLTISPWVIRNLVVLGKPWTSNSRALFLVDYFDFFNDTANLSLSNYLALGWSGILAQKTAGLVYSITNLVIVPSHLLLLPLFAVGIACLWAASGRIFAAFLMLSWLMCGIVFPLQSMHGTVIHISAFFYGYFYIFTGVGLQRLKTHFNLTPALFKSIGVLAVIVNIVISAAFINHFIPVYEEDFKPYRKLFAKIKPKAGDKIASANPLLVYQLTGATGALASIHTSNPQHIANKFACDFIITDPRSLSPRDIDTGKWAMIASESGIQMFRRQRNLPAGKD